MHSKKIKQYSKKLSWLLRHGALQEGVPMDPAGWVSVTATLEYLSISHQDLMLVLLQNNKARFELQNNRLRACQGHSLESLPITQEALEDSWFKYDSESDSIWHATQRQFVAAIKAKGLLRGQRSHVHLASTLDSPVGKRVGAPVLIEVSCQKLRAEGYEVFQSSNGVILTRHVPVNCILHIRDT